MGLSSGTRLGHFEVVAPIGAGGMGEVYKARDTRLDRIVAIKVLPAHLADKPDRRERFEREARTIASLNHPHICTLYDVGHQDGTDFLVMEYLEGETLATRLLKGPLPLEQVLQYAIEISDALDKAHRKGVTHRDIKPGNVMLTRSSTKLLDFGLAKLRQEADPAAVPFSQLPTLSRNPTVEGSILGTLQYMAPEQVEGKVDEIDGRTDIFAFGALVYEMATGKKAFEGKTTASVMAKILESDPPPISTLQPMTPAALDRVVKVCLAKERDERWQTAGDLCRELEWIAEGGSQAADSATTETARSTSRRLVWGVAAGLICGALLGVAVVMHTRPSQAERTVRFNLSAEGMKEKVGALPLPSPDGTAVVYLASDLEGKRMLWLRPLDSEDAKPLAGTEDAIRPFWSPDGRWIGFYSQGKLKKVSRDGASVQTIAALSGFDNGAWSSTGEILYEPGNRTPIYRIPDSGGTPQQVTKLDESRTENSHRWITFLPDGHHFLFLARCGNRENNALYEGSLDSGETRRVAHMESNVAYVPSLEGRGSMLLFVKDGKLFEEPFDGSKLQGEPVPLMNVQYNAISIQADFALSADGRVLVTRPAFETKTKLTWFDRKGTPLGTLGPPGVYEEPRISPDGSRVIFNRPDDNGGNRDIWSIEMGRGIASHLTLNPANEWNNVWSPDGRRIIFASDRSGNRFGSMFEKSSMEPGAGEAAVPGMPDSANPQDWSADGRWIAFNNGETHETIWIASAFGEKKPFQFLQTPFEERNPRFSPDAKWIAYHSNESGRFEVYARPFSGGPAASEGKLRISERGGYFPTWSRGGQELFFIGPDAKLYVATITGLGRTGRPSSPRPLFEVCSGNTPTGEATQGRQFDVAADGQKFLFVCWNTAENHYSVLVNWKPQ